MALARRLGFAPFAEKILLTFKDSSPEPPPYKPDVKVSTPIEVINAIFEEEGYFKDAAALKEKYGAVAVADARKVFDAAINIPWYGGNYAANRSRFESDIGGMFPGLSDKAIEKLHTSYASGWIP